MIKSNAATKCPWFCYKGGNKSGNESPCICDKGWVVARVWRVGKAMGRESLF